MLQGVVGAENIIGQARKLSRNVQCGAKKVSLFIGGVEIRNGKNVVEPPTFQHLGMRYAIPDALEGIVAVVNGNLVAEGIVLVIGQLSPACNYGFIYRYYGRRKRQAPVAGEFDITQPFERLELILHKFITQVGDQL